MGQTPRFYTFISFPDQFEVNVSLSRNFHENLILYVCVCYRIHLERGIILLDLEARDLANLHFTIVEEWVEAGILDEDLKPDILRTLLYK